MFRLCFHFSPDWPEAAAGIPFVCLFIEPFMCNFSYNFLQNLWGKFYLKSKLETGNTKAILKSQSKYLAKSETELKTQTQVCFIS